MTLKKEEFKILFMDDEIYQASTPPYNMSKLLESQGFQVVRFDKMLDALKSMVEEKYHFAILDIDMSQMNENLPQCENGMSIAHFLAGLEFTLPIMIYSARGGIEDWFLASQYHVYYYADKKDMDEKKFLKTVEDVYQKGYKKIEDFEVPFEHEIPSPSALIYLQEDFLHLNKSFLEEFFQKEGVKYSFVDKFSKIPEMLEKEKYSLVFLASSEFPTEIENACTILEKIASFQPFPHLVLAVDGHPEKGGRKDHVITLTNLHPFSLVNMYQENSLVELEKAFLMALSHYGCFPILDLPDLRKVLGLPMEDKEEEDFQ